VDLPLGKRIQIGLTYIFGIGKSRAGKICQEAVIDLNTKVKDLTEEEAVRIRNIIQRDGMVEGDLRKAVSMDIKRLMEIGSYRTAPSARASARGQRTHTNARIRKGREGVGKSRPCKSDSWQKAQQRKLKRKTGKKREAQHSIRVAHIWRLSQYDHQHHGSRGNFLRHRVPGRGLQGFAQRNSIRGATGGNSRSSAVKSTACVPCRFTSRPGAGQITIRALQSSDRAKAIRDITPSRITDAVRPSGASVEIYS
jgi:small subunit ribosomal protein S13